MAVKKTNSRSAEITKGNATRKSVKSTTGHTKTATKQPVAKKKLDGRSQPREMFTIRVWKTETVKRDFKVRSSNSINATIAAIKSSGYKNIVSTEVMS